MKIKISKSQNFQIPLLVKISVMNLIPTHKSSLKFLNKITKNLFVKQNAVFHVRFGLFLLYLCLHAFNTRDTTTLLDRKFKKDCSFLSSYQNRFFSFLSGKKAFEEYKISAVNKGKPCFNVRLHISLKHIHMF